jgi:hypothetical protein
MLPDKKSSDKLTGPYGWEFHRAEDGFIPVSARHRDLGDTLRQTALRLRL